MKTIEERIVEIAKLWKGHEGVNYETTTVADLLTLIEDAVKYDQKRLREEGKCVESGTPRVDAAAEWLLTRGPARGTVEAVRADFARTLERELNAALHQIAGLKSVTKV